MDIHKIAAAHAEMRDHIRILNVAVQIRDEAEARMLAAVPNGDGWVEAAAEYVVVTTEFHRLQTQIAILKGCIRTEATTV